MKKYWFRRKRFGWGWTPSSWEGWLVTAVFIVLIVAWGMLVERMELWSFLAGVFVLASALILIAYKKGEKPRWSWGT